jgi:hypothetical protein
MELNQEICGLCLRPRDELEIEKGRDLVRARAETRKRRPYVIARRILAVAALYLAFHHRDIFFDRIAGLRAEYHRKAQEIQQTDGAPTSAAGAYAVEVLGGPLPKPAGGSTAGAPAAALPASPASDAPRPRPRSAAVPDLPVRRLDSPFQWALYGRVYNLISLLPVGNARLVLTVNDKDSDIFVTDAEGRFSTRLTRLSQGGYEIHNISKDYLPFVFYEPDIPYAKLPLEERRELARNAQDDPMTPPSLSDIVGEESVRRDLFIAPRR